jgi:protein involved in polysaccharide export with SLBB domain
MRVTSFSQVIHTPFSCMRLPFYCCMGLCIGMQICGVWAADTNSAAVAATSPAFLKETVRSMDSLDNKQKLGSGDRIAYRVIEDQDEPRELLITDSGDMEVPYLGLIHASGKTCLELAQQIKASLEKKLYYKATVMVSAQVINKTRVTGKVYVTGQVRNSGGFDVQAGETLTVSRAILHAGGFSDFSDKRNVRLIRATSAGRQTRTINVQEIFEKGAVDKDPVVLPGDLIVVPERLVKW